MSQLTPQDLTLIIGDQTVQLRVLESQVQRLAARVVELEAEAARPAARAASA